MQNSLNTTLEEDIRSERLERIILKTVSEGLADISLLNNHKTLEPLDDEISSLAQQLVDSWSKGCSPKEMAQGLGQPIRLIYDILRNINRVIIEDRIRYYEKQTNI